MVAARARNNQVCQVKKPPRQFKFKDAPRLAINIYPIELEIFQRVYEIAVRDQDWRGRWNRAFNAVVMHGRRQMNIEGWIASKIGGSQVLHFSRTGGWRVEAVLYVPIQGR